MISRLARKFTQCFGGSPLLVRSPGRINLIGEHTDYNNGFVLPASIDKEIVFAIQANEKKSHYLIADDIKESLEVPIDNVRLDEKPWANYLLGIIDQLNRSGVHIPGVDCVFGGNIPMGAGLSSSAALETGFVFALNELFSLGLNRLEMIKISQRAEHEYAGVKCGIMDQFAAMQGQKNQVIRLDCRSLEYKRFSLDLTGHDIILCDSGVKHNLAASAYNQRRRECEQGVLTLQKKGCRVDSLRDVTRPMLLAHRSHLDPKVFLRCNFVVQENQRLLKACSFIEKGEWPSLGQLMYQTHVGLKDEYEVSCPELDILVSISQKLHVTGSRMMGGGFGGSTINLVEKKQTHEFIDRAAFEYEQKTGIQLKTHRVSIEKGTGIVTP